MQHFNFFPVQHSIQKYYLKLLEDNRKQIEYITTVYLSSYTYWDAKWQVHVNIHVLMIYFLGTEYKETSKPYSLRSNCKLTLDY